MSGNLENKEISFNLPEARVGLRLRQMQMSVENMRDRTPRVAKQVIRNSGFDVDSIRGAISVMCSVNYAHLGHGGMSILSEKLAASVGYVPTLGLCVGPELG